MRKNILAIILVILLTIVGIIFADPNQDGNQTTSLQPVVEVEADSLLN